MRIGDSVIGLHRELRGIKIGKSDVFKGSQNKKKIHKPEQEASAQENALQLPWLLL